MRHCLSAAAITLCLAALPAFAQVPQPSGAAQALARENRERQLQQLEWDTRLRANPEVPPGQRLLFDYGGYASFNYLSVDDPRQDNHGLRDYELVAYTRFNLDGAQELFLRGRTEYRDYNPGDSFDGRGSRLINPDLDRGYYRFDLQRAQAAYGAGPGPLSLTFEGGRDLAYWANGLTLTEVLDGGRLDFGLGPFSAEAIVGVTPTRTVDIDTSRPSFDFNTRRVFYGVMIAAQAGDHRPFVYLLEQRDQNEADISHTGPITTRFNYNSYYVGVGSSGNLGDRLRYGVEGVYEGGKTLSNSFQSTGAGSLVPVIQTRDDISAWALDARLDYLSEAVHETRYTAELILASGDPDRGTTTNTFNGNRPGTNDRAFNGFGLLNTGLAFSPEVSNLLAGHLGASTFPLPGNPLFRRMQIGGDFFIYGKLQRKAPIAEPTADHSFLGVEPDVYVNWQVASDVTLALRYGAFFPDKTAFGSSASVRQFFFGGLTFAF